MRDPWVFEPKVVLSKSTTSFQKRSQFLFMDFQTTTIISGMLIRSISTRQSNREGRATFQSIFRVQNVRSWWFGWFHTHLEVILHWFFWPKICENSCFWRICSTLIAAKKFSRRPSTTWWVWKMIYKHRATRRIKNRTHTTSQSKIMDGNVKTFHFSQEKILHGVVL